jgi:hypothetical protein
MNLSIAPSKHVAVRLAAKRESYSELGRFG